MSMQIYIEHVLTCFLLIYERMECQLHEYAFIESFWCVCNTSFANLMSQIRYIIFIGILFHPYYRLEVMIRHEYEWNKLRFKLMLQMEFICSLIGM